MSTISIKDRLVLFGYGVFETLRVEDNSIEVPLLHFERMQNGAKVLGLSIPEYTVWLESLKQIIKSENNLEPYSLRITLSGGEGQIESTSRLLHHVRPIPYTDLDYQKGLKICLLTHPRNEYSPCVHIKSTSYLENLLAKKEAEKQGAREGIWLNTKGYLAEGTISNLFFIKDDVLYTPALECGCLPGTRRKIILECANKLKIPVKEGSYLSSELEASDEIFITNALMGIMPVNQIGDKVLPSKIFEKGSLTSLLKDKYWEQIRS